MSTNLKPLCRDAGGVFQMCRFCFTGSVRKRSFEGVDQFAPTFRGNLTKAIETLRRILEKEQTSVAVIDEPPLKPSNERFLTEPIK